jgi:diaminopimelate epimerase
MFNADGSVGEMCGNGIRCLVAFAFENGMVSGDMTQVVVDTLGGDKTVCPVWENGKVTRATVRMGEPVFSPDDIPVLAPRLDRVMDYPLEVDGQIFNINCISMGNPHAVAFLDDPVDDIQLHQVGPQVEHHPMFPSRVNFEIANVLDEGHIKARVWERGSGLTEACGTGACAVGAVARLSGRVGDDVDVALPGGELRVRWKGWGSEVILEGPVEFVFEGEWPD